MKDQPWDLNRTWHVGRKWCQFVNAPKILGCPPQKNWGAKNNVFDHLFRDFRTWQRISLEQTKILVSIYNKCPLQVDLLFVTFDPETAEIHWLVETHPWKFSIVPSLSKKVCYKVKFSFFHHCRASHTKANKHRPTKFYHVLEGLIGLLSTVKSLGKFVPKNFAPSLCWNFWPLFCDFLTRHRITPERNVTSTNEDASVSLRCIWVSISVP